MIAICENNELRTSFKRCMSDTASYKKRVVRDGLLTALHYDKLISKNSQTNPGDKELKFVQINEAKYKLMKKKNMGEEQYDMGWWRRCKNDKDLMYGTVESSREGVGGCFACSPDSEEEIYEEYEEEDDEKYELFRNERARRVRTEFMASLQGKSVKDMLDSEDEGNGGENGTEMQSIVLWVARLDAWILTVVKCMSTEESRGGQRQKLYVDTFT